MEHHAKIINYSIEWKDKLRDYMIRKFPIHTETYIDYCVDHADNQVPSKLVINDKSEVVGCHLYYCTKVMVKGQELDTQWGHDTLLDNEYRAEVGWKLVLAIQAVKGRFCLGLTETNIQIHKKFGYIFYNGVYTYYSVTWKLFLSPFQKYFSDNSRLYHHDIIKVGKYVFKHIDDARKMTIPYNGYWFNGSRDIDFIRDASFLNERFVMNKVHDYYLYVCKRENDICYFVIRKASYRGFPALTISDFRYTNPEMVSIILKAVKKLAVKSNLGIIIFVCGDIAVDREMKQTLHFKKEIAFAGHSKLAANMSYCITGADSDADFLK